MFCVPLIDARDAESAGGKAAALSEVIRLGFRVPETVVVTRDALRQVIEQTGLADDLADYVQASPSPSLAKRHRVLSERLHACDLPGDLRHELTATIEHALVRAPAGLAIRSSAVYEDSPSASFAGVFESFIAITEPETALRAVLDCWASAWTPRAIAYLQRMGIEPIVDSMAVMIQHLVPATTAGVITTANPDSGSPWEFVLHATRGLSVDLMSGSGVGDRYLLDWHTGATIEREIVKRTPALAEREIAAVAATARRLDEALGKRLDIEWAIDGDPWILQARPLTAVPEFFPIPNTIDSTMSWQRAPYCLPLRAEQPKGLLTPLYGDMSMSELWYRYQPADIVLTGLWLDEVDVNGYRYTDTRTGPTFLDCFREASACEPWLERNEGKYRERWDARFDEITRIADTAKRAIEGTRSAAELIPVMLSVRDAYWDLNSFGWSGPQSLGWMCEWLLSTEVRKIEPEFRLESLFGGEDSHTFQLAQALQELGRSIHDQSVLDVFARTPLGDVIATLQREYPECDFLREYESLCWRFGKTSPAWRQRPAFWRTFADEGDAAAMRAVRSAMRGESRDVRDAQLKARADSLQAERSLRSVLASKQPDFIARFDRMLQWMRYWTQALNDRHGMDAGTLWERELIWHVGTRLRNEGLIRDVQDVVLLRAHDLRDYALTRNASSFKLQYEERLFEYRRNCRLEAPPVLGAHADAPTPVQKPRADGPSAMSPSNSLRGVGFGRGQGTGQARVIHAMTSELLESLTADDVLVVLDENAFAYADWHSLLMLVKGVVSTARPSHHLMQVAREIGVPVIGHVKRGLDGIQRGALLRLDAETGIIELLDAGHQ